MTKPFPRDTHLTTIAVAYKNPDVALIADSVLPRVPVGKRDFKYYEYPLDQGFSVPNTFVGERGQMRQVELSGTPATSSVEDFGIEVPLTASDIKDAPKGIDPRGKATEVATNIILLDREVRVARKVFNAASYAAGNSIVVDAGDKFSNKAGSNPLEYIQAKLDLCAMRPNVMIFGQAAWSAFRFHPLVIASATGTSGGTVTRERIAELLEVSEVLVGTSLVNSVKPGKTPVLSRVWGGHAAAIYRDRSVNTSGGLTFGFTAEYETRVAGSQEVAMGVDGGTLVAVGEKVKELVIASRAGFFFENAVA